MERNEMGWEAQARAAIMMMMLMMITCVDDATRPSFQHGPTVRHPVLSVDSLFRAQGIRTRSNG